MKNIVQISSILTIILYRDTCLAADNNAKPNLALLSDLINRLSVDPTYIINEILAITDILKPHEQNIEDASLTITELAAKYDHPVEEHQVVTQDGYELAVFRMASTGPAIFLMHGIYNSADDWLIAGPESALAYLLAEAGYEVWMGNARGTKYSRGHKHLSPEDTKFWDFSWDEIGRYDLPAMIDYVDQHRNNKTKLAYIGHSQGTTCFFVMCSEKPDYNEKFSIMIALSPLAWLGHVDSPIIKLLAPHVIHTSWLLEILDYHELVPKNVKNLTPFCDLGNGIGCLTAVFAICGFDFEQVNTTNTLSILSHLPNGVSLRQVLHYLQIVESKVFQRYNHGIDKNEEVYGVPVPPQYPVERVTTPVALIYGDNDWLVSKADLEILKHKLPKVVAFHRVPYKKFNHLDYIYARNVKPLVYNKVLQLLGETP